MEMGAVGSKAPRLEVSTVIWGGPGSFNRGLGFLTVQIGACGNTAVMLSGAEDPHLVPGESGV
jgi:hypothetical protein